MSALRPLLAAGLAAGRTLALPPLTRRDPSDAGWAAGAPGLAPYAGERPAADVRQAGTALWWLLRVGAFLCFVGHGAFGVITKEAWVPFFGLVGIGHETAYRLMPLIGTLDILVGTLTLLAPRPALVAYLVVWTVWTAALRPLTGLPVWEALERAGNYGVPLTLLLLTLPSGGWRAWLAAAPPRALTPATRGRLRTALAVSTALLLVGHGALAVAGKPELIAHAALLAPTAGAPLAAAFGWVEIALALLVLARPSVGLCVAICAWKLATESLFLAAGAPVWEVVERGGSYVAPLALAFLLWIERRETTGRPAPARHG